MEEEEEDLRPSVSSSALCDSCLLGAGVGGCGLSSSSSSGSFSFSFFSLFFLLSDCPLTPPLLLIPSSSA